MVLRTLTFIQDDPYLADVRPGSPHPFFYLFSSASSSPDVWSNCIAGFAAGIASVQRRCFSSPQLHSPGPGLVRAELGTAEDVSTPAIGYSTNLMPIRVLEGGSIFGRVGEIALDLIDTVTSGLTKKPNELNILAFEVASTIVRASNLLESLSEKSISHLKEVVLPSEGMRRLVSSDMNELLEIAATDKKEELNALLGDVARFGNHCRDPQWHNLDRYLAREFRKLLYEQPVELSQLELEALIQRLMAMAQYTAELYYELQVLDGIKQEYITNLHVPEGGSRENLFVLRSKLRFQLRRVRSLKKKSLWSRTMEEVVEQLVEICYYLHSKLHEAFQTIGCDCGNGRQTNRETLGSAGWCLNYANIVTQISAMVAQPTAFTLNTRDALFQGLPRHVKAALRHEILAFDATEQLELTFSEITELMDEKLRWLVPMANKTIKAHHRFGWLVEWANLMTNPSVEPTDVIRIETLHHADIERTDFHILELLSWLHILMIRSTGQDSGVISPRGHDSNSQLEMSHTARLQKPGTSRSRRFSRANHEAISRSHRLASPSASSNSTMSARPLFPKINSDIDWIKVLDVIDGVDRM